MTQLTEHFTLAEMTVTSQPFDNTPTADEIENLRLLCEHVLEPIRAHYKTPVRVNSGFRSHLVNTAVGSKDTSQHRKGQAADIEVDGVANGDLAVWIRDNLTFDQVILESYHAGQPHSGWVHVSWSRAARPGGSKGVNSVLTMALGTHGATYSVGIHA